ncbi:MAG: TRAM domain-containing protein, partial [Thermosynechococcaceae cyanobacterium]
MVNGTSLSQSPWKQDQLLEIDIDDLSASGEGVGHWGPDRQVVFVPDSLPGDRIVARLTYVKSNYAHGTLVAVHT